MDPNFKTPYERKVTLGLTYYLPNDYVLTADAIMTQGEDTAIWKRGDLEVVGTNSDGSPDYSSVREPSFVLTNSAIGNESESISFGLFKSFENGVVKVELQGSCSGCPSSLMTLKQGVQNLLKHYVKEVNSVEAI